ncbi:MAG: hypothetical protein WBF06_09045 [Candidatus Acidiferrales bacterium]
MARDISIVKTEMRGDKAFRHSDWNMGHLRWSLNPSAALIFPLASLSVAAQFPLAAFEKLRSIHSIDVVSNTYLFVDNNSCF